MSDSKPPEFEPPQACVSRIIKSVLPENIQLTKDARSAFTRAAGIFIFYLTHCANDFSRDSKRSTIYTSDIIKALKELDFEEFLPSLEEFLEVYRREGEAKKATAPRAGGEKRESQGGDLDGDAEETAEGDNKNTTEVEDDDGAEDDDEEEKAAPQDDEGGSGDES